MLLAFPVSAQDFPNDESCLQPEPGGLILKGDANQDGFLGMSDAIYLLDYLFRGGPAPQCKSQADTNGDGALDITDAIVLLRYLFVGDREPAEIDVSPYLAMPSEVSLTLQGPAVFGSWFTLNFQRDVIFCRSDAQPTSYEGNPIELLSFRGAGDNLIFGFGDRLETVFSLEKTPPGEYNVRTTCEDVAGNKGETLTHLIINSPDEDGDGIPDGDGYCNAGVDQCCVRGIDPETGEKTEDYLTACIENPPGGPRGDLCKMRGNLGGDFSPADADVCNKQNDNEQGGGATLTLPETSPSPSPSPEAYCRVKCATVFYGQGQANCKGEKVSLSSIQLKNPLPGKDFYNEGASAWRGEPGVGGSTGTRKIDITFHIGTIEMTGPRTFFVTGNAFVVFAKYIPVDKNGKEIEGGNLIDGKKCREYQFVQGILETPNGVFHKTPKIDHKNIEKLTGPKATSLYDFWTKGKEAGTNGFLKNHESIDKEESLVRENGVLVGYSRFKECTVSGSDYCIDDYHQIRANNEYEKERDWPVKEIINNEEKRVLGKEYIQATESIMVYFDNPSYLITGSFEKFKKTNNFLIVVEDQAIAETVNHRIVCSVNGLSSGLVPDEKGALSPLYSIGSCECIEYDKKDNKWIERTGGKWTC